MYRAIVHRQVTAVFDALTDGNYEVGMARHSDVRDRRALRQRRGTVASRVGYRSEAAFSVAFKRWAGSHPVDIA